MNKALLLSIALSNILVLPALAQDWDDSARQQEMQRVSDQRLQQAIRDHDAQVANILRSRGLSPDSPAGRDLAETLNLSSPRNYLTPDSEVGAPPQKSYTVMPDANGRPVLVEDNRGPVPTFKGGFGAFDPDARPREAEALTPEMLQRSMPKQSAGSDMWENTTGSGFFGGMRSAPSRVTVNQKELQPAAKDDGPAWAKDRIQNMHHFVEGQEHHGAEDPSGFF